MAYHRKARLLRHDRIRRESCQATPSYHAGLAALPAMLRVVIKTLRPSIRAAVSSPAALAAILAIMLALLPSAAAASGEAQIAQGPCVVWLGPQSRTVFTDPVRITFAQCAIETRRIGYYTDGVSNWLLVRDSPHSHRTR